MWMGREVLIKLLHRSGYRVRGAGTVKDALALLRQEDFDLLIADIGLPDGTGIELMCEAEYATQPHRGRTHRL